MNDEPNISHASDEAWVEGELARWTQQRAQASSDIRRGLFLAAAVFLLLGIASIRGSYDKAHAMLNDLSGFAEDEVLTDTIYGPNLTIADVRSHIVRATWGPLVLHCVLAGVLVAAAFRSRRSPLGALSIAVVAYFIVLALRGTIDPLSVRHELLTAVAYLATLTKSFKAAFDLGPMPTLRDD